MSVIARLVVPLALRVVPGLARVEDHAVVALEDPAKQFAEKEKDDAGVGQPDAGLAPGEAETGDLGGQQVGEE